MTTQPSSEYIPVSEVAEQMGIKRATLYHYINALGIKTHKFKLSRQAYLAASDVERIKEVRDKPWLAGPAEDASEDDKNAA